MNTNPLSPLVLFLAAAGMLAGLAPGQTPIGGSITVNTTLVAASSPYVVTSDLVISTGATLTIEPGVTLRFTLFAELILNNGAVDAQGTPGSPIVFTSDQTTPTPGSWEGIRFGSGAQPASTFRDCVVAFAGRANSPAMNLGGTGTLTLERVTIRECLQDGVAINFAANPTLQQVTIDNPGRHGVATATSGSPSMDQLMVLSPGDYGISISSLGSAASLTNSLIENGVRFPSSGAFVMDVSGNTFTNYDAFRARASPRLVGPFLGGNTFTGVVSGVSDIEVLGGAVVQAASWPNQGILYRITGTIDVFAMGSPTPPVLTLAPGVTLRCGAGADFRIGFDTTTRGVLMAQGTPTSPITFTSSASAPAPGQWRSLSLTGADGSILDHVIIEYGGSGGNFASPSLVITRSNVTVQNSTVRSGSRHGARVSSSMVSITGSTFSNNAQDGVRFERGATSATGSLFQNNVISGNGGFPLHVDTGVFPQLGGNVYTNNGTQAVEVGSAGGGDLDFTFANEGLPYFVTSTLTVGSSVSATTRTLTVQAGVTVRFDGGTSLRLGSSGPGVLVARGTTAAPITFTANTAAPTAGFWAGIAFNNTTPNSVMECCIVEYGATSVALNASSPTVERCTVRDGGVGVRLSNCTATVVDNTITGNTVGISVGNATGSEVVANNDLSGNGTSMAGSPSGFPIGAQANWWGSATGPSGIGPGTGGVATGMVAFEPWLAQAGTADPSWRRAQVSPQTFPAVTGSLLIEAEFGESVDWTITIRNSGNVVVRTFAGTGSGFGQAWNGTDALGSAVADGTYTFRIDATSVASSQPLAPAVGDVAVLSTAPTALITAPLHGEAVLSHLPYTVVGTASGSYSLQIGVGTSPSSFSLLQNGSFAVTNGPLGTFEPQSLSPGPHTLRLSVGSAPNQAVALRTFTLDYIAITDVSVAPILIDPTQGQMATVSYTLNQPADTVVMRLYSYPDLSFLTSRATASQSAGPNTITWDGTTTAGMLASDGGYFCTLEASNGVGQTGTFNSAASPILLQGVGSFPVWTVPGVLGTAGFDPYRNDLVQLSYMVDRPMVSTLQIHATDGGSPINSFRDLITGEVRAPGVLYTEFWDGRRDDGTIHNGAFFPYFGIPEKFPVHGVVVDVPEPEFQDFRAEAYVIQNGYREVSTFTYTLTRNATVSITITDPNGNLVRTLLSASPQTAGFQSVEWDGTNDLGVLVDVEGDYRIDLSATDAILPRATTRRGTVVVYR